MTKEERKEYNRKWYQTNKEKRSKQINEWYQANREKILEQQKQYFQENKEKVLERHKKYNQSNKEYLKEYYKEYAKKYRKTPMGRAANLLGNYNTEDKKHNRGKGDLTAEWIVENIFSKPCAHCGKEGWEKIGCNRIDNDKPHTKDNVEPCCEECNKKLPRKKSDN